VRRLVPVKPSGQIAAEVEETEDGPSEEIRQISLDFPSGENSITCYGSNNL
jgi:hypothetical protein